MRKKKAPIEFPPASPAFRDALGPEWQPAWQILRTLVASFSANMAHISGLHRCLGVGKVSAEDFIFHIQRLAAAGYIEVFRVGEVRRRLAEEGIHASSWIDQSVSPEVIVLAKVSTRGVESLFGFEGESESEDHR